MKDYLCSSWILDRIAASKLNKNITVLSALGIAGLPADQNDMHTTAALRPDCSSCEPIFSLHFCQSLGRRFRLWMNTVEALSRSMFLASSPLSNGFSHFACEQDRLRLMRWKPALDVTLRLASGGPFLRAVKDVNLNLTGIRWWSQILHRERFL